MFHKIMKISIVLGTLVFAMLLLQAFFWVIPPAQAEAPKAPPPVEEVHDWVIAVADINPGEPRPTETTGLFIVDAVTDIAYGPLLTASAEITPLGSAGGGMFDVAVTPDGKTAVVSNFGDSTVHYIDVSDPLHPSFIVSHTINFFAEDIAISYDGKYGFVTDGGFSPRVAVLDILNHTLLYTMTTRGESSPEYYEKYALHNAVDVDPFGTVLTVDYFGYQLNTSVLSPTGYLTLTNSYTMSYMTHTLRAVNVTVAPHGGVALAAVMGSTGGQDEKSEPYYGNVVPVYQITGQGEVSCTQTITGLPTEFVGEYAQDRMGQQSIVFNDAGDAAYVLTNGVSPTMLSKLNISSDGFVSLDPAGPFAVGIHGTSQLFGVDSMAIANNKLYLGNPTKSGASGPGYIAGLTVVDLEARSVITNMEQVWLVAGVAAIHPQRMLEVYKDGSGEGTVSSPSGIDCGETCSTLVNYNRYVTLTAEAGPYSAFTGWSGACSGSGTCTVLVTATRQVTATFDVSDLNLGLEAAPDPVLAGNLVRYTLVVSNPGPAPAPGVVVTDALPAGTSFSAADSDAGCTDMGSVVSCTVGLVDAGSQASVRVAAMTPNTMLSGTQLTNQAGIVTAWADPDPDNNHASVTSGVVTRLLVYNLLENPGTEWSSQSTTTSPSGRWLFGRFGNTTLTLNLPILPTRSGVAQVALPNHSGVLVTFDLATIGTWDGNASELPTGAVRAPDIVGPDYWGLEADDVSLLYTTFSNMEIMGLQQAFPGWYPVGSFPAREGAAEVNTLGYIVDGMQLDTVYHLAYVFPHQGTKLKLDFSGSNLQALTDESWALDNVRVTLLSRTGGAQLLPYVSKGDTSCCPGCQNGTCK